MAANIIALIGRRYSGKSICAKTLVQMDSRFTIKSFGAVLKEQYSKQFNIPLEKLSAPRYKEEFRPELIAYANLKKTDDGAYFAKALFDTIEDGKYYVIDDMRFFEELQYVLKHNGAIYHVWSEPRFRELRGWSHTPGVDDDYSETELTFLSAHDLYLLTKGRGGVIHNNSLHDQELRRQLASILKAHFPAVLPPDIVL